MTTPTELPGDELRFVSSHHHTTVEDWVILATRLSDREFRVYSILRMHCQGGGRAFPSQRTIAGMLGIKKTESVGTAIAGLQRLGVLTVSTEKTATGRRNVYSLHEAPPDGYDGPMSRTEFYSKRGGSPLKQGSPLDGGSPPNQGGDHPPNGGDGSPPKRGSEVVQDEVTQRNTPEANASGSDADAPCQGRAGQGAEDGGVVDQPLDLFHDWGSDQEHPPDEHNSIKNGGSRGVGERVTRSKRSCSRTELPPEQTAAIAELVPEFVDTWQDTHGVRPTTARKGQAAREIKQLIVAGNDPTRVRHAVRSAARAGYATIEQQLIRMTSANGGSRPGKVSATELPADDWRRFVQE